MLITDIDGEFDASGELVPAMEAAIRADADVKAAFAQFEATLRVYDLPPPASPTNRFPYVVLSGQGDAEPLLYDGLGSGQFLWTGGVWSRPDPTLAQRSFAELRKIAPAVLRAVIREEALQLPSYTLIQQLPRRIQYLPQPDGMTEHAVLQVLFSYDPI